MITADDNEGPPTIDNPFLGIGAGILEAFNTGRLAPETLCHYTSPEGLLGIVQHNTIRFSDVNFLNDGSEIRYGIRLFEEAADAVFEQLNGPDKDELVAIGQVIVTLLDDYVASARPIVFCLSSHNDLLNQWRNYGKSTVSYCVEFNTDDLVEGNYSFGTFLIEVTYDKSDQIKLIGAFIQSLVTRYRQEGGYKDKSEEDKNSLRHYAAIEAFLFLCGFKDQAFSDEKEWRLVAFSNASDPAPTPLFRSSQSGVVPYFEYRRLSGKLPIVRVGVGPSPYPETAKQGLQYFLKQIGLPDVQAIASPIPLRSW